MKAYLASMVLLSFAISGFADSVSVGVIDLPKEQDVVAFTNGLPSTSPHNKKSKDEIVRFLRLGKYVVKVPSGEQRAQLERQVNPVNGLFTDKQGNFYFWTLMAEDLLWLKTPEGGSAVLQIIRPEK
jgi:hypothetical protein